MRIRTLLVGVAVVVGLGSCGGDDGLSADAGDDVEVQVGESPVFDACGSSGDIANYSWRIVEAPASMADDVGKVIAATQPECSFTLEASMLVEEMGDWVIEVSVTDADGATSTDSVAFTVTE
jgi:hypothetical protein